MKKSYGLKFSDVIKKSIQIYFKNILAWLMIYLLIYLPMFICVIFMPAKFQSMESMISAIYSFNLTAMIFYFLPIVLFNPLAMAAITCIVDQGLSDKSIDIQFVLDNSLMKWKQLIFGAIIYYCSIVFTSFLILPSIYFAVSFYFYPTVIALSKFKGNQAMFISKLSLTGRWLKSAILIFVSLTLASILNIYIVNLWPAQLGNLFVSKIVLDLICKLVDVFFEVVLIIWFLSVSMIKSDEKEVNV